jgi:hypothetical protein
MLFHRCSAVPQALFYMQLCESDSLASSEFMSQFLIVLSLPHSAGSVLIIW